MLENVNKYCCNNKLYIVKNKNIEQMLLRQYKFEIIREKTPSDCFVYTCKEVVPYCLSLG